MTKGRKMFAIGMDSTMFTEIITCSADFTLFAVSARGTASVRNLFYCALAMTTPLTLHLKDQRCSPI